MTRRLLLSVHDASPAHAPRLPKLIALIERHAGPSMYAMLVTPNFHGDWPLAAHPAFRSWLREKAASGVEIFLHGLRHLDDSAHQGRLARWKAEAMTAGEGEFLGLDRQEAARRMSDGRAELEDIIGRPVAGFIAPAWLYGRGAMEAVADEGFALAEDHLRVWRPIDGQTVSRGPVITYATRTAARQASSLLVSRLATVGLAWMQDLRLAVHPHDADCEPVMHEIDRALAVHAVQRQPARYADLAAGSV